MYPPNYFGMDLIRRNANDAVMQPPLSFCHKPPIFVFVLSLAIKNDAGVGILLVS
jgi:hypothetical protein